MNLKAFLYRFSFLFMYGVFLFLSGCHKAENAPRSYALFKKKHQATASEKTPNKPSSISSDDHNKSTLLNTEDEAQENKTLQAPPDANSHKKNETSLQEDSSLSFNVKNATGKTVYLVCFTYIKKQEFSRWRWSKSKVHKLEDNQEITLQVGDVKDEKDRNHVVGYLAPFSTEKEAEDSIYELLDDHYQVDLDTIAKLKNKTVVLGVERYGIKGETLDYNFVDIKNTRKNDIPKELDFYVENQTGKSIWITCFVYEHTSDKPVWRFEKTPLIHLNHGEKALVDVRTIKQSYDWIYLRGNLAVFDEDEKENADGAIYELLEAKNKVKLGALFSLKGKKVVLGIENYGVTGDIVEFTIKPIRHIQFGKEKTKHKQTPEDARFNVWR